MFNKSFWSKSSFKSTSLSHGTAHNLNDPHGPYELSSSTRTMRDNGNWDAEAAIGHEKVDIKSEESLERRGSMGGDSREFIIRGKKKDGVTVLTTFQVKSEDVAEGHRTDRWQYGLEGGITKASVHAHSEA